MKYADGVSSVKLEKEQKFQNQMNINILNVWLFFAPS